MPGSTLGFFPLTQLRVILVRSVYLRTIPARSIHLLDPRGRSHTRPIVEANPIHSQVSGLRLSRDPPIIDCTEDEAYSYSSSVLLPWALPLSFLLCRVLYSLTRSLAPCLVESHQANGMLFFNLSVPMCVEKGTCFTFPPLKAILLPSFAFAPPLAFLSQSLCVTLSF